MSQYVCEGYQVLSSHVKAVGLVVLKIFHKWIQGLCASGGVGLEVSGIHPLVGSYNLEIKQEL